MLVSFKSFWPENVKDVGEILWRGVTEWPTTATSSSCVPKVINISWWNTLIQSQCKHVVSFIFSHIGGSHRWGATSSQKKGTFNSQRVEASAPLDNDAIIDNHNAGYHVDDDVHDQASHDLYVTSTLHSIRILQPTIKRLPLTS